MMAFIIIALFSLIMINTSPITISSYNELINYPSSPVIQSNSPDKTKIYAFINSKSFTIINKYASYNENSFNANQYIKLKPSTIIKPIKNNTIAIACGITGIVLLTETGKLITQYTLNDYNPEIKCSLLQVNSTTFALAYVFGDNYYIDFIAYDIEGGTMLKMNQSAVIPTRTTLFIDCELFDSSGVILCFYQDIRLEGYLIDNSLTFIDRILIMETDERIKILKIPTGLLSSIIMRRDELYAFSFEYDSTAKKLNCKDKNIINISNSMSLKLLIFDVVVIETKNDLDNILYSYLVIACQAYDCFLIRMTSSFAMIGLMITIPSKTMVINTGLSLGIFNDRDVTMILSQGMKNFLFTMTIPACLRFTEVYYGTSIYYLHELNDDYNAEIVFSYADSIEYYSLISNPSIVLEKNTNYKVNNIIFKPKTQGSYLLLYKMIFDNYNESIDCSLRFNICYPTCDQCTRYGSVNMHKCLTCAVGYHPSVTNASNCEKDNDEASEVKVDCSSSGTFWFEPLHKCVSSCIPYNLLNNVITFLCVIKCSSENNEALNLITSECLSQENFHDQIEGFIKDIDIHIIDLYNNYPVWISEKYTMSIYKTGVNISRKSEDGDGQKMSIDIISTDNRNTRSKNKIAYASMIYLEECETILKTRNSLDISKPLIIAKFDTVSSMQLSSAVDFKVYTIEGNRLDMSICNDTEIIATSPIIQSTNPQFLQAKNYYLYHKIDLFNHSNTNIFFYDICNQFTTIDHTDYSLIDRFNELFLNEAFLCSNHCTHAKIDYENNIIQCSCYNNPNAIANKLFTYQTSYAHLHDALSSYNIKSNFEVFKCFHMVFDLNRWMSNVGSWLVLLLVILETIIAVYFSIFGHQLFEDDLLTLSRRKGETMICNRRNKYTSSIKYIESKDKRSSQKSIFNLRNSQDKGVSSFIMAQEKKNQVQGMGMGQRQISKRKASGNDIDGIRCVESSIEYEQMIKGIIIENKPSENDIIEEDNDKKKIERNNIKNSRIPIKKKTSNFNPTLIMRNSQRKETDFRQLQEHIVDIYNVSNNNIKSTESINVPKANSNTNHSTPIEKINDLLTNKTVLTLKTIGIIFWYYLQNSHPIIRCFCLPKVKKATKLLYLSMIIFCLALNFSLNTMLYSMSHVSMSYKSKGRINYSYNFPIVLYSFLLSLIFKLCFNWLSSFELIVKALRKTNANECQDRGDLREKLNIINWFKCRLSLFYIAVVLILIILWYYVTAFCSVYPYSQLPLLLCCISCFLLQLLFPLIISAILVLLFVINMKYEWRWVIWVNDYLIMLT